MDFLFTFLNVFLTMYGVFWIWNRITSDPEKTQLDQAIEELEDAIILCRVEQLKDVFYLYNAQDDNFIGQARNMNDFNEISERLKKHIMIIDGDDSVVEEVKRITSEIGISK